MYSEINGYMCELGRDKFCPATMRMVTAVQEPLHHHLKSVHMSGFCDVSGLAELTLYILGNATVIKYGGRSSGVSPHSSQR